MSEKIMIAALGNNHVIGADNTLPWDIPEEFNQFLEFIKGNTVIIGRKSFEIFKAELTGKYLIIISRQKKHIPGAVVCHSADEALQVAESYGRPVFIAGGGEIYRAFMDHADYMYLSFIKGDFKGNTTFPEIKDEEWKVVEKEMHDRFEFRKYARINNPNS